MTPQDQNEIARRRKARNMAVGLALGALVLLIYMITIVRMGD